MVLLVLSRVVLKGASLYSPRSLCFLIWDMMICNRFPYPSLYYATWTFSLQTIRLNKPLYFIMLGCARCFPVTTNSGLIQYVTSFHTSMLSSEITYKYIKPLCACVCVYFLKIFPSVIQNQNLNLHLFGLQNICWRLRRLKFLSKITEYGIGLGIRHADFQSNTFLILKNIYGEEQIL